MASTPETLWTCDELDGVTATAPGLNGPMPTGWAHVSYTPAGGSTHEWDLCPNSLQQTIGTIAQTLGVV